MTDPVLSSLMCLNRRRIQMLKQAILPYHYMGVMHMIVLHIRNHPGASQEEIASFFALDKTSVARDTKRLEEMHHIYRVPNQADRRQNQLYLTEEGEAFLPILDQIHQEIIQKMSRDLSAEEWATLGTLLEKVNHNLE